MGPDGPFTLLVEDALPLGGGTTILMGRLEATWPPTLAPCKVELMIDGRFRGIIDLVCERPAPATGLRAVETRAPVDIDEIRSRPTRLVHR